VATPLLPKATNHHWDSGQHQSRIFLWSASTDDEDRPGIKILRHHPHANGHHERDQCNVLDVLWFHTEGRHHLRTKWRGTLAGHSSVYAVLRISERICFYCCVVTRTRIHRICNSASLRRWYRSFVTTTQRWLPFVSSRTKNNMMDIGSLISDWSLN